MTALLTDNLPLLAGAPNGIKKLRELILELAVRGKLVPQDPNDEPASELLKCIAEEKARLVEKGRSREQKSLQEIDEASVPYMAATGWAWIKLGDISLIERGGSPRPIKDFLTDDADGLNWIKIGDTDKGGKYITSAGEKIRRDGLVKTRMVYPGDFLLTNSMSFGRPYITQIEGCIHDGWLRISPPDSLVKDYLYLLLSSPYVRGFFAQAAAGAVVLNLNADKVRELPTPLPPLAEQHRIVAKVDELMALCDRLEARQADSDSAHTQLVQALLDSLTQARDAEDFAQSWQRLAEHFHTLFTTESSIDALKQTLLQLAVMGKLVPQDPSDESAMSFLKVNGIEGKPYTLHGWAKAQLGQLGEVLGGSTPSKANSQFWDGNIPWVSPKDMKRPVIHDSEDHVSPKALEETSLKAIPPNSLLMVVRGMILAHSFPVAITAREVTINQDMKALVPPREVSSYLLMYLQAVKSVMVGLVDRSSHGTCKLVSEKLWAHAVLLPPLAEQHRIVAKVDQLMALCDQLKARLNQAHQVHEQLANALVEQAVA